ncbi:MAG TPA: hypothetical protein VLY63_05630 [Anaerolineae bacterium]|nr:hypothetical protein [Anaerolineae bacterium]
MKRQLKIADVIVGIDSRDLPWDFSSGSPYDSFLVREPEEHVHVEVHWHGLDRKNFGDEVFSARDVPDRVSPNWCLYRDLQGLWALEVNTSVHSVFRQRVAVFGTDLRHGELYVDLAHRDLAVYPYPLGAPLDRVLFVNLIAQGLGVMLHACGIVCDGKGYIFAGPPEAGKTTLARLWSRFGDATVLGDECLILRRKGEQFWVYGTPWVGEAGLCSPVGAPTEGIFFIRHDLGNLLTPIAPERAVERLLAQSFLAPYDASAVGFGLDFCLGFVADVPAFDFGFVPEASAVRLIQSLSIHA